MREGKQKSPIEKKIIPALIIAEKRTSNVQHQEFITDTNTFMLLIHKCSVQLFFTLF